MQPARVVARNVLVHFTTILEFKNADKHELNAIVQKQVKKCLKKNKKKKEAAYASEEEDSDAS